MHAIEEPCYENITMADRTGKLVFTDIRPDNISSDRSSLLFYWSCTFSVLVWLALGAEAKLEHASEKSLVWCGRKDIARNATQEKNKTEAAVVSGVPNPSSAPALIALNIFNALNRKKKV